MFAKTVGGWKERSRQTRCSNLMSFETRSTHLAGYLVMEQGIERGPAQHVCNDLEVHA